MINSINKGPSFKGIEMYGVSNPKLQKFFEAAAESEMIKPQLQALEKFGVGIDILKLDQSLPHHHVSHRFSAEENIVSIGVSIPSKVSNKMDHPLVKGLSVEVKTLKDAQDLILKGIEKAKEMIKSTLG